MSEHHPSCRESDRDLVWHCSQCGLNESAEEWHNAALAVERELREHWQRRFDKREAQLDAAVEALKQMPEVAYKAIIEGAGVNVENLPNELQYIADAALAKIGER